MERRKFFGRLDGIVFALSLLVSAYGADAQIPEKVRLGISDVSFTFLPHLVAKDTGIFQKRGLQVEVIFIGGPVSTAALAAGELDYSASRRRRQIISNFDLSIHRRVRALFEPFRQFAELTAPIA